MVRRLMGRYQDKKTEEFHVTVDGSAKDERLKANRDRYKKATEKQVGSAQDKAETAAADAAADNAAPDESEAAGS